jgi:hypothetical protein
MTRRPLSICMRFVVVRGVDSGRVGVAVDILEMQELLGGPWAALLEALRVRKRSRWCATWITLEFPEGDQGAFLREDLEALYG